MYAKCIKCGSENTHRSRIRPGERTWANLFLKPVRCRDCKDRFWVRNRRAYFGAAGLLAFAGLITATVWLVIEQNMDGVLIHEASTAEPAQSTVASTSKPLASAPEKVSSISAASKSTNTPPQSLNQTSPAAQKPKDIHQFTVQLYQDGAENGEADAQYKLGLLYLTGNGALQDFAEAAKWLRRAAEQGYALAQYELGLIYRNGNGFPVDPVKSYVWLNLAAAAGVQQAVAARDEVMRLLNSKQLTQAQKISRDWLASRTKSEATTKKARKSQPETDADLMDYGEL